VAPESIAHYRISSKLGEGAMGEVYRAIDSKLGREVAIKLIPEDFAKDATRMARFTREAQVLASLNHPNIAAIYGVEDRALIMELVEGETLAERIKNGPIPFDEALEFARQIADGLSAAHDKGVVHRDLKPANIKITPGGTIKLLDFGLAKADGPWTSATSIDDAPTLTVASTGQGVILGTAAYMAPEQARGRNVDKRADIWAYGVIIYEMLTGSQMFAGDTVTDVLASVVRLDPDLARVPASVRPMLRRCLEKDPKKRLRDVGDALLLLDAAPAAAAAPGKRLTWALAGLAALLAIGLAALSYAHFRATQPPADVVRFQMGLPDKVSFTQNGISAISPDGRKIAFAAYGADGMPRIWIRPLDSSTAAPLEDALIGQQPLFIIWSPDGRYIGFGQGRKFQKIDVTGGPVQSVSDITPVIGAAWGERGILLGTTTGIVNVPPSGGTARPVTKLSGGESSHAYPVFLPDGRHFLYLRGVPPGKRTIGVGDLDSAPEAQSTAAILTTDTQVAVSHSSREASTKVLFLRDTTLLAQDFDMQSLKLIGEPATLAEQVVSATFPAIGYFSASNTGTLVYRTIPGNRRQLTWLNREGQVVGTPGEPRPYSLVKVSPDGTKAAVVQTDTRQQPANADIWIVDLKSGESTRFTFDPGEDAQPVWSPDSKWLAWMSTHKEGSRILRKAVDGSGTEEELYSSPNASNLTDWTRNGYLILTITRNVHALPVVADATGKRTPIQVVETPGAFAAYVSPDGRWITYMSSETGRRELFVQPFAPGNKSTGKWLVSTMGTMGMARWRADNKELMFVDGMGSIVTVNVTPAAAFQFSAPRKLFQFPLELFEFTQNPGTFADVTRDNERFLMMMPVIDNAQRELSVVMNWQNSLKK
jgi:Tol biopolymer transport system component